MFLKMTRRALMTAVLVAALPFGAMAQEKVKLRLSSVNSETDQRAIALVEKFGPAIADFATFEPTWGGTLFEQGAKAEFISPEMSDLIRKEWVVGIANDDKSRDLGYAIGQALNKLHESGKLKDIFAKFGVTYIPPPEG